MKKAGFGLSETILRDLKQAFARFDWVKQVLVFGSRAKGNYRPGSDIDLAVIGEESDEESTNSRATPG